MKPLKCKRAKGHKLKNSNPWDESSGGWSSKSKFGPVLRAVLCSASDAPTILEGTAKWGLMPACSLLPFSTGMAIPNPSDNEEKVTGSFRPGVGNPWPTGQTWPTTSKTLLVHSYGHLFMPCLWLFSSDSSRAECLWQRPHCPQTWKYLFSGSVFRFSRETEPPGYIQTYRDLLWGTGSCDYGGWEVLWLLSTSRRARTCGGGVLAKSKGMRGWGASGLSPRPKAKNQGPMEKSWSESEGLRLLSADVQGQTMDGWQLK